MFRHEGTNSRRHDHERELDAIVQLYLAHLVGHPLETERLAEFNTAPIVAALQFLLQHGLDSHVNLAALTSTNEETMKEHQASRDTLFRLLDAAVKTQRNDDVLEIVEFDESAAKTAWSDAVAEFDQRSLQTIHADSRNLGIVEKLLQKKLTPHEWLSEIDLQRLRQIYRYDPADLVITKLSAENIGLALHFARINSAGQSPYQIGFILNTGGVGSVMSQGDHWTRMLVTIDLGKKEVSVQYRDSGRIDDDKKKKIENLLKEAITYQDEKNSVRAIDLDSREIRLTLDVGQDIKPQKDLWSCGYRAFAGIIADGFEPSQVNQKYENLRKKLAMQADVSSEFLRDQLFSDLFLEVAVDKAVLLHDVQVDFISADPADEKKIRLNPNYVESLVANLGQFPTSMTIDNPSLELLQNRIAIDKYKIENIPVFRERLLKNTKQLQKNRLSLEIDLDEFIQPSADPLTEQGKLKALFACIREMGEVYELKLKNVYYVMQGNNRLLLIEEFSQLLSVCKLSIKQERLTAEQKESVKKYQKTLIIPTHAGIDEFERELQPIAARNKFISLLNKYSVELNKGQASLVIDPEQDIWMQLCQKRLSNPTIFMDKSYTRGELNIFTTAYLEVKFSQLQNRIDKCVVRMGPVYLWNLLTFIDLNRDFFATRKAGFPFKRLEIGHSGQESLANRSSYFEFMKRYLSTASPSSNATGEVRGRYFPFTEISIHIFEIEDEDFERLKHLLEIIGTKYKSVTTVELRYIRDDSQNTRMLRSNQYDQLIDLFERFQIELTFNVPELSSVLESSKDLSTQEQTEILDKQRILNNTSVRAARARKQNQLFGALPELPSIIERTTSDESPQHSTLITRPYKNKSRLFDVRSLISVDVDVQSEVQNQMQLQSQIEQEVQQEYQITSQNEVEVEASEIFRSGDNPDLVGYTTYTSQENSDVSHSAILSSAMSHTFRDVIDSFLSSPSSYSQRSMPNTFWRLMFGANDFRSGKNYKNNIKYMTRAAMAKIHSLPEYFIYGLSIDNLPVGFYLEKLNEELVLCFDETKFIENKNESPLTVTLARQLVHPVWRGDLRGFIPTAGDKYSPAEIASFLGIYESGTLRPKNMTKDKLIKLMAGVDPDLADNLLTEHTWFFDSNDIALKPKLLTSLADLIYDSGCVGITILLNAMKSLYDKDKPLFDTFKQTFLDERENIRSLVRQDSVDAIRELASMSYSAKVWWITLTAEHMKYNEYTDIAELYNGFKYFLSKMPSGVDLPLPVPFLQEKTNRNQYPYINMLVYLDRLLATLSRVKPRLLMDQLENLQDLSFDQESVWYAARWEGFRYFHREMHLYADSFLALFEQEVLGKNPISYVVEYGDLVKIAMSSALFFGPINYPAILFHRFVGRAENIYHRYQYYVDLTDSIKKAKLSISYKLRILALLALATTGQRGANGADYLPLLQFATENQNNELIATLDLIMQTIKDWEYKPNVDELFAIIQLVYQIDPAKRYEDLSVLRIGSDISVFRALVDWSKNPNRLNANQLIKMLVKIINGNSYETDYVLFLARVNASSNQPPELLDSLIESINRIDYEQRKYVWHLLASIDLNHSRSLPSLADVTTAVRRVLATHSHSQILFELTEALPNCLFHLNQAESRFTLDLDRYADALSQLNKMLQNNGVDEIDIVALKADTTGNYIQGKINLLFDKMKIKNPLVQFMSTEIYRQATELLRGMTNTSIDKCVQTWPELGSLTNRFGIFAEPGMTGKLERIGEDFVKLNQYASGVELVMETLIELHRKFGQQFKLDFLVNSLRARQLNYEQINTILIAFRDMETAYYPGNLLDAIFLGEKFSDTTALQEITVSITYLLQRYDLTVIQKTRLLSIAVNRPADIKRIVDLLRDVAEKNPNLLNDTYRLLLNAYKQPATVPAVRALAKFVADDDIDMQVKSIILKRLADYPDLLMNLCDHINSFISENKKLFVDIIAYSLLERDEDAKTSISQFYDTIEQIHYLVQEASKSSQSRKSGRYSEMDLLKSLYHTRPYPGLKKIQHYVSLKPQDRSSFAQKYHVDPPGLRTSLKSNPEAAEKEEKALINAQFDRATAHERIDQIRDLSRVNMAGFEDYANQPLFYTNRKNLFNHFLYVNSVGVSVSFPLSIPGDFQDKEKCQIPVINLEKNQIQKLILHYRKIISDQSTSRLSQQEVLAAKLEFVALIREAMYRTTGKFPYSTQIISLLNVMLHGGDVFSEIRTGEGKGCITALFSAFKWIEGNAVDVCSSNMELAQRDLEEFSEFYSYLGIKSNLISARSKATDYCDDGINYSDMAQLALFQEKMFLAASELPEKVACVLDEADFHALDSKSQFRFAANLDEKADVHLNPNEWIYPHILKFVSRPEFITKVCSPKQDVVDLREYIRSLPDLPLSSRGKFERYADSLLDKWIDSAYIASRLVEREDFTIQPGQYVIYGDALQVQVAKVKINHRESADSTFSDGVHQFLHTRLNLEIDSGMRSGPKFPIEPEKSYLASRSSKNLIDYYRQRGGVLGLTGTVGSSSEIAEMSQKYGFKFFRIPPHKQLLRIDHPPVVASLTTFYKLSSLFNQKSPSELKKLAHFDEILKQVKLCQKIGQPVLLICQTVDASAELYAFLSQSLSSKYSKHLQLFNGEQKDVREKDVVENAGLSGMITVTTPMLGRGTDIKPRDKNGNPIPEGLYVIDTFIDPDRDFGQKIGRSGRNGARGATKLILSEAEFDKYQVPLPKSESELASAINTIRAKLNDENAEQRKLREIFADIKDQYFNQYVYNLKKIKSAFLSAFEHYKLAGGEAAWSSIVREMYLKWEAFLVNLDKKSKKLLTDQHAASEGSKSVNFYEQSLLFYANPEWSKLVDQLELIANSSLKEDLAKLGTDYVVEPIMLSKTMATAAKDAVPSYDPIPEQLEFAPLDPYRVNVYETYLRISGSSSEDVRLKYITKELIIAYDNYFPGVDPRKALGSVSLSAEGDGDVKELNRKICTAVVRRILDEYYGSITNPHYNTLPVSRLLKTAQRLMTAIGRYGDDDLKAILFTMFESEMKVYRSNISHLNTLTLLMATIKNVGAIKEDEWIDIDKIMFLEASAWETFRDTILQQLNDYTAKLGIAEDRKRLAVGIIQEIKKINQSSSETGSKIQQLAELVKNSLSAIVKVDFANEYTRANFSIFSHRNPEKSRLWEILSAANKKMMLYLVNKPGNELGSSSLFASEISHIKTLLDNLILRSQIPSVANNRAIKQLADDAWLSTAVKEINNQNEVEFTKSIALIYARLTAHIDNVSDAAETKPAKAFLGYFNELIIQLRKFKENKHQVELLIPVAQRKEKNAIYASKEKELFDLIQKNMHHLLNAVERPLILPVSQRFTPFIDGNSFIEKLARQALVDIAKSVRKVFPDATLTEVTDARLDKENAKLNVVVAYQKGGVAHEVKITVDSFSLDPLKRKFVLCQWPTITSIIEPDHQPKPR